MKSLKEQFISHVVGEAVARSGGVGGVIRVLDMGCGTAVYVPELLKEYPNVQYVGVEPIKRSFEEAKKNLTGIDRATVHLQLGYDAVADVPKESFDLVFSLSVLEHIKQLERFIATSAGYLKKTGILMHRYDLGHALHTHSLKERLHVLLGNHVPQLLPERQFVRYVPEAEVRACYEKHGVTHTKTTYHQMLSHKRLEKFVGRESGTIDELFAWEMKYQAEFGQIPPEERESLFPAVAVWGEKR